MKKRKVILGLCLAASLVCAGTTLVSCGGGSKNTPAEVDNRFTVKFDTKGGTVITDQKIEKGGLVTRPTVKVEKPDNGSTEYTFEDWYSDPECTEKFDFETIVRSDLTIYAKYTEKVVNYTVKYKTYNGTNIQDETIGKNSTLTEKTITKSSYQGTNYKIDYTFGGWYSKGKLYDFKQPVKDNLELRAKWNENKTINQGYEEVNLNLLAEDKPSGSITQLTDGIFNISGCEIRGRIKPWNDPVDSEINKEWAKSYKLGNSTGKIQFVAPATGTMRIYVQNGSGSAATQTIKITEDSKSTNYEFAGTNAYGDYDGGSPVVALDIPITAGKTYSIGRGASTIDVFEVNINYVAQNGVENGFEIKDVTNSDYVIGSSFDPSTVNLRAVYDNQKRVALANDDANVSFDTSAVDFNTPGEYNVTVRYKSYTSQTFKIKVWDVESIKLGFNETYVPTEKSSAGNTMYVNGKTKLIYSVGDAFNPDYLSVYAHASYGSGTDKKTMDFLIEDATKISYSAVDTSTSGEKTVTVTFTVAGEQYTTTYKITVVSTDAVKNNKGEYIVNVNSTYTGVAGAADNTLGNQFKTIGEALEFLGRSNIETNTRKVLTIEAGTYNEKLEVKIPNLTIQGNGTTKDDVLIEWDSLYGIPDEGGYYQVTDSTQTMAVREEAVNCIIKNLTISNWWNSKARFDEKMELLEKYGIAVGGKVNDHRGLALLVQADKYTMDNCSLLGYQDTVQFFKGRQYINNCYIAGATDYIFGTNCTVFFNNCEIHAIYTGTDNGGYTAVFKGSSAGESDTVEYGAIFYQCNFTADKNVGSTALGRPWARYATVAFIKCVMGSHISTEPSTGASSGERYVSMSGVAPTVETVRYYESGNTGAGAISKSQAGVTVLSEDDAKAFYDFSIIFGKTNGKVTYTDTWNPNE